MTLHDWQREITARLQDARLSPADEAALVHELADHLQDRYEELLTRGMEEAVARDALLAELECRTV